MRPMPGIESSNDKVYRFLTDLLHQDSNRPSKIPDYAEQNGKATNFSSKVR
jgi:hypothetical protein